MGSNVFVYSMRISQSLNNNNNDVVELKAQKKWIRFEIELLLRRNGIAAPWVVHMQKYSRTKCRGEKQSQNIRIFSIGITKKASPHKHTHTIACHFSSEMFFFFLSSRCCCVSSNTLFACCNVYENRLHFMRRTEKCFNTNLLTIDVVFDFLAIVEFLAMQGIHCMLELYCINEFLCVRSIY